MLKIRLRRMGSRHKPFYRVVVSDSRLATKGRAVEEIGIYDPRTDPPTVRIEKDRVEHWVSHGARMSPTVKKLMTSA